MFIKVVIASLSTTTLTANDLITLNLPHRIIFPGNLFGVSFLLNPRLFANMEEGKVTDSILVIVWTVILLGLIPLFLEFFHMIFHCGHRTPFAPPPQRSLTSASSGEISLSPTDTLSHSPTEGSVTASFT